MDCILYNGVIKSWTRLGNFHFHRHNREKVKPSHSAVTEASPNAGGDRKWNGGCQGLGGWGGGVGS